MASTFGILETAKSGLSVSMENLKITGHNIANANTVGYTRQRLVTSAKETNAVYLLRPTSDNLVGQGVEVLSIQQVRSAYLDDQYRDLNSGYNYSEYTTQSLTYLEGLFNSELKDGEGLTGSIEDFFDALNTFTKDSTSQENRITVQKSALSLTQNFNLVYGEMESLWEDQNDSVKTVANEINAIAKKLGELNKAIAGYERTGETANDLRDERNLLLDELSGYVNISCGNNPDNASMVDVSIGGVELVSGSSHQTVQVGSTADQIDCWVSEIAEINQAIQAAFPAEATTEQADRLVELRDNISDALSGIPGVTFGYTSDPTHGMSISYDGVELVNQTGTETNPFSDTLTYDPANWSALNGNQLTLGGQSLSIEAGTVTGGELYAHLEQINSDNSEMPGIPYYMEQLNTLARTIAQEINNVHLTGYSYDTDSSTGTTTSDTGIYFFNVETESVSGVVQEHYDRLSAGNFSISDAISESVWNIAGSSVEVNSDGSTLETGNSEVAASMYALLTDSDYYSQLNGIVGHLAIAKDTSTSVLDTRQSLLTSVDTQRNSVSGVSTDEETTNLIVYQQSYNACARVISAIDEMLNTMINNMGMVGR